MEGSQLFKPPAGENLEKRGLLQLAQGETTIGLHNFKTLPQLPWAAFFWRYLKERKGFFSAYIFLAIIIGLYSVFNAYALKLFINLVGLNPSSPSYLALPLVLLLANSEMHNCSWRGINWICLKVIPVVKSQMTRDLFDCAHAKPHCFFQQRLSGTVAQDISIITEAFERTFSTISVRLIRGISQWVASFTLMSLIHIEYATALLCWTVCFTGVSALFTKKIRIYSRKSAKAQAEISGQIVDSFSGSKEIRLFRAGREESRRLSGFVEKWARGAQQRGRFLLKFYLMQGFSITCLIGAVGWMLTKQYIASAISLGDLAYILSSTFFLAEMIWANTELFNQFNEQMGSCSESLSHFPEVLFGKQLQGNGNGKSFGASAKSDATSHSFPIDAPFLSSRAAGLGKLSFESVCFSHQAGKPLFEDFSLEVYAGEKLGIVGRSGAGKSTLIHLLLGLFPLSHGRISVDGVDIRKLLPDELYKLIAVVSQDSILFQRTVEDNLRICRPSASEAELMHAINCAELQKVVKNRAALSRMAAGLSGGQKQRIAMARAVLHSGPILVLDEPTSQLDSLTELDVKASLLQLMEGRTTLAITHHLATLIEMDRIIVIDQGKIAEEGTHEDLLRRGGCYARLWEAQAGLYPQHAQKP